MAEDPSDPDLANITLEAVTINGKKSPTQNDAVEFLLAMFLMYGEGYDNKTGNQAGGEVLYKGYPVAQLLGSKPEELNQIFGAPTDTGILYGATEYYTYNDVSFMLDDQGAAVNITIAADVAEIDGATLDQTSPIA